MDGFLYLMIEMTSRSETQGAMVSTPMLKVLDLGLLCTLVLGGAGTLRGAGHAQRELWPCLGNSWLE